MNRGRGKHLCRICEQNLQWLKVAIGPDSGIFGLQAGEDVKSSSVLKIAPVSLFVKNRSVLTIPHRVNIV
jgi:hypothetical protein